MICVSQFKEFLDNAFDFAFKLFIFRFYQLIQTYTDFGTKFKSYRNDFLLFALFKKIKLLKKDLWI